MKRFRFSLDSVLSTRRYQEQLAQQQFAEALRLNQAAERRLASIRRELSQALSSYCTPGRSMPVRELQLARWYIDVLRARESAQLNQCQLTQQQLTAARSELLEAQRKREVLEKLKEKQQVRYRLEYNRAQHKQLDEIAQQMFVRR